MGEQYGTRYLSFSFKSVQSIHEDEHFIDRTFQEVTAQRSVIWVRLGQGNRKQTGRAGTPRRIMVCNQHLVLNTFGEGGFGCSLSQPKATAPPLDKWWVGRGKVKGTKVREDLRVGNVTD